LILHNLSILHVDEYGEYACDFAYEYKFDLICISVCVFSINLANLI